MKKKDACKTISEPCDLDAAIKCDDGVVVLFYATWCPFSQAFLPVFMKSADECPTGHASIAIDDLDDVVDNYSIEVYPTVLYFKKGHVVKRLNGVYHRGLDGRMLKTFIDSCSEK